MENISALRDVSKIFLRKIHKKKMPHNNDFKLEERRRSPRISRRLPFYVKSDSHDLVTETINISSSGAYCQVDKYIEPMTKVAVVLFLPIKLNDNRVINKKLKCEGVVVRTEESRLTEGKFNIAVFFNNIKKVDLNSISRYIASHLQLNPAFS